MECIKLLCLILFLHSNVMCQFGFFPQRDNRQSSRASPFGLFQNILSGPSRIRNTLSGILHVQPAGNDEAYVINDNRPPEEYQTNPQRPNNVRFPAREIPNDDVNFEPQPPPRTENHNENPSTEHSGLISGTVVPAFAERQEGLVFGSNNGNPSFENRNGGPDEDSGSFNSGFTNRHSVFEETCQTLEGQVGSCIVLTSCEPYMKLVTLARTDTKSRLILQKSHCGFEQNLPKVCCPRPGIPTAPPTAQPIPTAPPTAPPTPATAATPTPKTNTDTEGRNDLAKNLDGGDFLTAFPEPPVCGYSNSSFSRIVGGVDAKLGDFPWIALLGYQGKRDTSTRWRCGGSLITAHHVLTAAHCIHNHEDELYVVRLGELDLIRDDDGASPVDVLLKSKIKHEHYNSATFENDIGVLVLQKDVQFTDLISPVCLPTDPSLRSQKFERFTPMIAGWGDVQFRGPSATHLQVVQLPVQTNELCVKAYAKYPKQVIDERVLCAGFKNGGKDACQGDSGGPMMLPYMTDATKKFLYYQIGVVSYGKNCAEAGFPGVYSRVTYFLPWLEKVILGA